MEYHLKVGRRKNWLIVADTYIDIMSIEGVRLLAVNTGNYSGLIDTIAVYTHGHVHKFPIRQGEDGKAILRHFVSLLDGYLLWKQNLYKETA